MIAFTCIPCGLKLEVKEEFAGRKGSCPRCKQALEVPTLDKTLAHVPVAKLVAGQPSSLAKAGVDPGVTLGSNGPSDGRSLQELLQRASSGQRYHLESEIARGGMGAVLRAVDCDIRREVAVKYLLDQNDAGKKLRFIEEAQVTGQLEHPNIVPIHELGIDGEQRLFFSMKMVKGRSLEQVLDQLRKGDREAGKEYTLGRMLTILVGVCNAMAYAHSRGVVHRDLKPANIMLGDFGEVYVMDWGLAKVLASRERERPEQVVTQVSQTSGTRVATSREPDADLTQEGAIMGTPTYMAPEQAMGKIQDIDGRTDVYALGAILYEMLTLLPPIDRAGGYYDILMRVSEGTILPPEQRTPERARKGKIPAELSAIARKGLATDMANRYATVEPFRKDIERYLEGRSVSAKTDTRWESFVKLVKRNKGASAGTATALVVFLVSLVFLLVAWQEARAALRETETRTKQAVPALLEAARMGVERRNFKNALEQVNLALLYAPDHVEGRMLKAQILIVEGEFADATSELDRYLLNRPEDANAQRLKELCGIPKPEDVTNIIALSQVFEQQETQTMSVGLLMRHTEAIEARKRLLKPYQKKIDSVWPDMGKNLTLDKTGLYSMSLSGNKQISNLAPLEGMPLSNLNLTGCAMVEDLTPLKGMPLTSLNLTGSGVRDLTPLKGLRLTGLILYGYSNPSGTAKIHDLSPLQGMPLTSLDIGYTQVQELSPLTGMPLTTLSLNSCGKVSDLSPLKGMPIANLNLYACEGVRDLTPLRDMPLTHLNLSSTKLQDLSPLQGKTFTNLLLDNSQVRDLSPLKGMPFTSLSLKGCGQVRDLKPLEGMSLANLNLTSTGVFDLSPLKGMPLTSLNVTYCGALKDLSPLREMKLTDLNLYGCGQVKDLAPLQGMPLVSLDLRGTQVQDLTSLKGMPLTTLYADVKGVDDLTPLEGLNLQWIYLIPKNITKGMDVLRRMQSLKFIGQTELKLTLTPDAFWKRYDAGEFKK